MKVDILSVQKETHTLKWDEGEDIRTTAVIYKASVTIGTCQIRGDFKFDEDKILDEETASIKIKSLFFSTPRKPIR